MITFRPSSILRYFASTFPQSVHFSLQFALERNEQTQQIQWIQHRSDNTNRTNTQNLWRTKSSPRGQQNPLRPQLTLQHHRRGHVRHFREVRRDRQIRIGQTRDTKGTAYVVYEDIYDAKAALEKLSGFNVANRYLIVLYFNLSKFAQKQLEKEEENLRRLQKKEGVSGEQTRE